MPLGNDDNPMVVRGPAAGSPFTGTIPVSTPTPATISSRKAAVTTAPTSLAALGFANGPVLKAGSSTYGDTNVATVWIGGADLANNAGTVTNGYPLAAGEPVSYAVANASAIYACTATGVGTLYSTGN